MPNTASSALICIYWTVRVTFSRWAFLLCRWWKTIRNSAGESDDLSGQSLSWSLNQKTYSLVIVEESYIEWDLCGFNCFREGDKPVRHSSKTSNIISPRITEKIINSRINICGMMHQNTINWRKLITVSFSWKWILFNYRMKFWNKK